MSWFRKSREKLQQWQHDLSEKIPRKTQVFINLGLILVLPLVIYVLYDSPVFDPETAFRRAEKANLVGPSEILGIEEVHGVWGDTYVIGDNGDSAILYLCGDSDLTPLTYRQLVYRPKMGSVSVYGLHQYTFGFFDSIYPLIVMDDYPEAVRAELELELYWQDSETLEVYRKSYQLSAEREHPGYFRMDIQCPFEQQGAQREAISQFARYSSSPPTYLGDFSYPATVRLYDEQDKLICEQTLDLFPEAIREGIGQ